MLPYNNKAFATTWVFADCLLFVGMLNPQNSLLTENVVTVCYYIFLCRAFQFAATFFMDRVIFEDEQTYISVFGETRGETQVIVKQHQPNIVASCCQLCSFWCFVVTMLHFLNSFYLPYSLLKVGAGDQTYALQLSFVIIMSTLELARHLLLFYSVLIPIKAGLYHTATRIIFVLDCLVRASFVYSACIVIPSHLGDQNNLLYNFLLKS